MAAYKATLFRAYAEDMVVKAMEKGVGLCPAAVCLAL